MTANHAHFEELCALEASAQLATSELAELYEHSRSCSSCSERLLEMTQVSAQLFSAHVTNQPCTRMPREKIERFIALANNEGVPLTPRAPGVGFGVLALAAALLLVLLFIPAIFRFGLPIESGDETMRNNPSSVAPSIDDRRTAAAAAKMQGASVEAQPVRSVSGPQAGGNGRGTQLLVSHADSHLRPSQIDSGGLEQRRFNLTVYSQNLAMFHRPFSVEAKFGDGIQWVPARYEMPKFQFAEPSEFAENNPPRLLAEYEHRISAPWSPQDAFVSGPVDVQVLRRDFDPTEYKTLLTPDFKRNLPAFQFIPNANQ